jgi:hypothetical protein
MDSLSLVRDSAEVLFLALNIINILFIRWNIKPVSTKTFLCQKLHAAIEYAFPVANHRIIQYEQPFKMIDLTFQNGR